MLINGKDLSEYNAKVKQWRFAPDLREIKNESEWERGSVLPIFQDTYATFKPFTVTLMVYGGSRDEILQNANEIIISLMQPAVLKMDGWTHYYKGYLDKSSMKELSETSRSRFQELTLEFNGYEYGDEVSVKGAGGSSNPEATTEVELTINNPGNVVSPAIIEITPSIGQANISVSGLCRDSLTGDGLDITISNTTTDKTITIDGIDGFVLEDGEQKAGDVDMWALPTLLPGKNTVVIDTQYCSATLTVLPIYR